MWDDYFNYFSDDCSQIICGKNAIKTVAISDMTSCHCSCPKHHQGDPNIECTGKKKFNNMFVLNSFFWQLWLVGCAGCTVFCCFWQTNLW